MGVDAAYRAPASAAVIGGNLPINAGAVDRRDINAHNSPTLVQSPRTPSNLVVSNRIDTPSFSCALHVSLDGGTTWAQTPLPIPPGEEPKCFAPDAVFDADGVLYLSYVTLRGTGNVPNAVWLVTSRDGGVRLSEPRKALGPLAFQVRLLADPASPGRLLLFWLQAQATATLGFPETGYPIQFTRSADGGSTWERPVRVSSRHRQRVLAPSPAVGENEVLVVYLDVREDRLDYNGGHEGMGGEPFAGHWSLVLARSADGGATWNETVVEDELVPTERFLAFLPPYPSLAVDSRLDRVYVGYHDARLGDRDVWLWTSANGRGFGPPTRVNDTSRGDGTSQYLPKLAVAPDGRVDVAYYDRRTDADDVMNEVSFQSSFDHGKTFTPRLTLSDRAFDSRIGFGSEREMPDLGSRLALLSLGQRAMVVWADTRAGTQASNKQDIVRAVIEVSPPGPLLAGGALRPIGLALLLAGVVLAIIRLPRRRQARNAQSDL